MDKSKGGIIISRPSIAPSSNKPYLFKQRGAAGIEAVLLLPIMLVLLFAIIHYSMIFFAASLFNYAAKEGIRNSMSYVDERCYFEASGCDDDEALALFTDPIKENTAEVIQNFTTGNSGLGKLFGKDLGDINSVITVDPMEGGGCCKVTVNFVYDDNNAFLPKGIIDGLLPGDESVFPNAITASASMKLN